MLNEVFAKILGTESASSADPSKKNKLRDIFLGTNCAYVPSLGLLGSNIVLQENCCLVGTQVLRP